MKIIIENFKCGKCNHGIVKRKIMQNRSVCEISIHKCDNCKYQYGVKEVNELELIIEL